MDERAFDPTARAVEKQRSRDEDELALRDGSKTREQLRQENGLFVFANVLVGFGQCGAPIPIARTTPSR